MTTQTQATFDLGAYQRAYEEWDVESLLALYTEDVEQIQLDDATPPSAPGIYRGRARLERMFTHCKDAGVKATVENPVAGDKRAAATVTCEFPGGRRVVANVILDLHDGRIARELVIAARDAERGER